MPSGNSVAALALQQLAKLTDNQEVAGIAERQLKTFAAEVQKQPQAFTFYLMALSCYLAVPKQVVIAGSAADDDTWTMLATIGNRFLPHTVVMLNDTEQREAVGEILPHISGQEPIGGRATAYICENFACKPPITNVEQFTQQLAQLL